jgi:hypothetical protein
VEPSTGSLHLVGLVLSRKAVPPEVLPTPGPGCLRVPTRGPTEFVFDLDLDDGNVEITVYAESMESLSKKHTEYRSTGDPETSEAVVVSVTKDVPEEWQASTSAGWQGRWQQRGTHLSVLGARRRGVSRGPPR